jgi:hypothetical protein
MPKTTQYGRPALAAARGWATSFRVLPPPTQSLKKVIHSNYKRPENYQKFRFAVTVVHAAAEDAKESQQHKGTKHQLATFVTVLGCSKYPHFKLRDALPPKSFASGTAPTRLKWNRDATAPLPEAVWLALLHQAFW